MSNGTNTNKMQTPHSFYKYGLELFLAVAKRPRPCPRRRSRNDLDYLCLYQLPEGPLGQVLMRVTAGYQFGILVVSFALQYPMNGKIGLNTVQTWWGNTATNTVYTKTDDRTRVFQKAERSIL
jgi:hypothetical protein